MAKVSETMDMRDGIGIRPLRCLPDIDALLMVRASNLAAIPDDTSTSATEMAV